MSHSPTPWTMQDRVIQSSNGENVSGLVPSRMTTADAALIIRCVNAHDTLMEALKRGVETMEASYAQHEYADELTTLQVMKAALAAAETPHE